MENAQFQELVLQQLKVLTTGQTDLKQGQARLEERQTKLEQRQVNLEQGFAKLEQRQVNLEQGFAKLEQRQARLEEKQEHFEKKLDSIFEQTAMLTEFRTEVNEKLDLLQRKQDRQEKILERLSLRSIEQEADIAYLRMAK